MVVLHLEPLYSSGKSIGFEIKNRVHISDSLLSSCVTFGKLFKLSAGLFFINGQNHPLSH